MLLSAGWQLFSEWGSLKPSRFGGGQISSHEDFLAQGWFVPDGYEAPDKIGAAGWVGGLAWTGSNSGYRRWLPTGTAQIVAAFSGGGGSHQSHQLPNVHLRGRQWSPSSRNRRRAGAEPGLDPGAGGSQGQDQ